MIGPLFLCVSVLGVIIAAQRSAAFGIVFLMGVGYFYGLLRANFTDIYTYLSFDISTIVFYAVMLTQHVSRRQEMEGRLVRAWTIVLIGWPVLLFLVPHNHVLVQLVGLRHVTLFLPWLLIGARTSAKELDVLAKGFAVLNAAAFAFALYEYWFGIALLYPPNNPVNEILYRSQDVTTSGGVFYRLPATFSSAHAFGGTMLITLPLLLNSAVDIRKTIAERWFFGAACVVSVLGVLLAGARSPVLQCMVALSLLLFYPGLPARMRQPLWTAVIVLGSVCVYYFTTVERMQRVTTAFDFETVRDRIEGSVNLSLLDVLRTYPMGAGLGTGFGSSMPNFLQNLAPQAIGVENEYARIAVEQGIIGFLIWVGFVLTFVLAPMKPVSPEWRVGSAHMKIQICIYWATALLGAGLLQSIPGSAIMLFQMGLLLRQPLPVPHSIAQKSTELAQAGV